MEMVHFIPPDQRRLAMLAAQAEAAPALICGADGTGKGAIARWIHSNGARAARTFVTATQKKPLAEQIAEAQGGTIVVPEIGEWPLSEQRVLLQFLKTKAVTKPGDIQMLLNVRVIATSSHGLEGRAQGGLFNSELLEKLNVFRIEMPPLSDRAVEFEDIVIGIVGEITRELHKEHIRGKPGERASQLSKEAWLKLRDYDWPGNLRELRNVLRMAVIAAKGDRIEVADLPEFGHDRLDFRATREQFEKIYILELLKTFDWQIDRTCRVTRIDRDVLLAKMTKYGISRDPKPESGPLLH